MLTDFNAVYRDLVQRDQDRRDAFLASIEPHLRSRLGEVCLHVTPPLAQVHKLAGRKLLKLNSLCLPFLKEGVPRSRKVLAFSLTKRSPSSSNVAFAVTATAMVGLACVAGIHRVSKKARQKKISGKTGSGRWSHVLQKQKRLAHRLGSWIRNPKPSLDVKDNSRLWELACKEKAKLAPKEDENAKMEKNENAKMEKNENEKMEKNENEKMEKAENGKIEEKKGYEGITKSATGSDNVL
ncbi:MAG: hypothetical protein Q9166_004034 [cf. Caloplaca sp. 2 TL-2023]